MTSVSEAMYKAVGMNTECLLKIDFIDLFLLLHLIYFLEHYKAGLWLYLSYSCI